MHDREVEWQLAASDLEAVRRWLHEHARLDGLTIQPGRTVQIEDVYYDTSDWRIREGGFALRVRNESGQFEATLKALRSKQDHVADREELKEPLDRTDSFESALAALLSSAAKVGSRVKPLIDGAPLRPLFKARTTRQKFLLRDAAGTADKAEIALDDAVLLPPDSERPVKLLRVEVEALSDDHHAPERFVTTLCAECGLTPTRESKFVAGLKAAGLPVPAR